MTRKMIHFKQLKICTELDCDRIVSFNGLCPVHYSRARRLGQLPKAKVKPTICKIETCNEPIFRIGFCQNHYYRYTRFGDPLMQPEPARDPNKIIARDYFKDVILVHTGRKCFYDWDFSKTRTKRPLLNVRGKGAELISRLICEEIKGSPIEEGYQAAHLCGNGGCINPQHIALLTVEEHKVRDNGIKIYNSQGHRVITVHDKDLVQILLELLGDNYYLEDE